MMVSVPIKRELADDFFAMLIAILMFYSIPNLPLVKQYFEQSPYVILGIALVLLMYRKRILEAFRR